MGAATTSTTRTNLLGLTRAGLEAFVVEMGEKPFRARQLFKWIYKDEDALSELQRRTHKWLQSLLELQSASGDSAEFLEHVKVDLFSSEVYVFTPKGKIIGLHRGGTGFYGYSGCDSWRPPPR